ncbi:MAG: ester cyclase [Chitinophagales bacterium]
MKTFKTILSITILMLPLLNLTAQTTPTMTEKNKSIAIQFYSDVINEGDTVVMHLIMAENFVDHYADPALPKGIEGFQQFLTMVATAYPDVQVSVEEMIAEGDKVAVRLTVSGTQTGMLLGKIPPSGNHAVWTGIDILKIENEKITERWSERDLLGMMKQIGVIK